MRRTHLLTTFIRWFERTLIQKKINIFLWELHHESINIVDRLQRRIPYICLSSSWCVMCLSSDERLCHLLAPLLICFCYWSIMLEPFGVHSHCLCLVTYMMFLLPSLWAILSMVWRKHCGWLSTDFSGPLGLNEMGNFPGTLPQFLIAFWI